MIIWKCKGILIFLYFLATVIFMRIIVGLLRVNFESFEAAPFEAFMRSTLITRAVSE